MKGPPWKCTLCGLTVAPGWSDDLLWEPRRPGDPGVIWTTCEDDARKNGIIATAEQRATTAAATCKQRRLDMANYWGGRLPMEAAS